MLKAGTKFKTKRAVEYAVTMHARPGSLRPHVLHLLFDRDREASIRRTQYLYPAKPPEPTSGDVHASPPAKRLGGAQHHKKRRK
jgi:hypothetical protein